VVLALGPLIRVGVRAHGDGVAPPLGRPQLGPEAFDGVDLDDELAVEVITHVEVEILMGGASEAVRARMAASPVRVDGEAEGHARRVGDLVDDALGVDVQELEAAVLALADMTIDELVLGEERGLAAVVLRQPPPEPLCHQASISNWCSDGYGGALLLRVGALRVVYAP
jgi:hypothetical protein